jgi:hypothetical protein
MRRAVSEIGQIIQRDAVVIHLKPTIIARLSMGSIGYRRNKLPLSRMERIFVEFCYDLVQVAYRVANSVKNILHLQRHVCRHSIILARKCG